MTDSATNRFAPPVADVADLPNPDGTAVLAGRGARLGAAIIDALVAGAICCAVMIPMYGASMFFNLRMGFIRPYLPGLTLYYIVFLALQGWFLYQTSQTVGKKLVGLRIVRPDGSHASLGRLLGLRTVLVFALTQLPYIGKLFGLVDTLFIFGAPRRCLHDLIADTIVVTAESSKSATLAGISGDNLRTANF
jgi:uncharacterized RDD family membrane protein YckC